MSCAIDFLITPDITEQLYDSLEEKNETAGVIHFQNQNNNFVSTQIRDKTGGQNSSVKSPFGIINFHTHPRQCYLDENTIWGWPSGEDMREVIKLSLKGNLIHVIITLEGIYTIQINPCMTNLLKKVDSRIRSTVIALIEIYFKSSHIFRTVEFNKWAERKKGMVTPWDFVKFANLFNIENLISEQNKCGKLNCAGVPIFETNCKKDCYFQSSMEDFIEDFMDDDEIFVEIDERGTDTKSLKKDYLKTQMYHIIELFKNIECDDELLDCVGELTKWRLGQWFNVCFFPSSRKHPNNRKKIKTHHLKNTVKYGKIYRQKVIPRLKVSAKKRNKCYKNNFLSKPFIYNKNIFPFK